MRERRIKISYVKKPFARYGFFCLPTAVVAVIFAIISLSISVSMQGSGDLNVGAWGLSSLLFAFTGLAYGGLSFLEREKNYVFSKIGMVISGLLVLFWLCLIIVGLVK